MKPRRCPDCGVMYGGHDPLCPGRDDQPEPDHRDPDAPPIYINEDLEIEA